MTEPPETGVDRAALAAFLGDAQAGAHQALDEHMAALRDTAILAAPARPAHPAGPRSAGAGVRKVAWWAQATGDELAQYRRDLERFVEWLIAVYDPGPTVIPDCWQDHPALVYELWALERLCLMAHSDPNNPSGPGHFTGTWAVTRDRLRALYANTCSGGHQPNLVQPDAQRAATRVAQYVTTTADRSWAWPPTPSRVEP